MVALTSAFTERKGASSEFFSVGSEGVSDNDPYGQIGTRGIDFSFGKSASYVRDYRFAGEQYDADLGQYFLRARYYNPEVGRFHNRDTFEGFSSDPVSLHKYAYASLNPVLFTDPSGMFSVKELAITSTVIGVFTGIAAPSLKSLGVSNNVTNRSEGVSRIAFGIDGALIGSALGVVNPALAGAVLFASGDLMVTGGQQILTGRAASGPIAGALGGLGVSNSQNIVDTSSSAIGIAGAFKLAVRAMALGRTIIAESAFIGDTPNRFNVLASGVTKAEARELIRGGSLDNVTAAQISKISKQLRGGRVDRVSIKTENVTGNVRLTLERAGQESGFQRLSFKIDKSGNTTRTVQTAFDNAGDLVIQPGGIRFDVK